MGWTRAAWQEYNRKQILLFMPVMMMCPVTTMYLDSTWIEMATLVVLVIPVILLDRRWRAEFCSSAAPTEAQESTHAEFRRAQRRYIAFVPLALLFTFAPMIFQEFIATLPEWTIPVSILIGLVVMVFTYRGLGPKKRRFEDTLAWFDDSQQTPAADGPESTPDPVSPAR